MHGQQNKKKNVMKSSTLRI